MYIYIWTADVGYLCENFNISKYFTVINEIFLLDLGICEDFSENDKIIPTKSKINTQNGEYICILYKDKSKTFSKQNINSHETLFNLKIVVNPVDGHIGLILLSCVLHCSYKEMKTNI